MKDLFADIEAEVTSVKKKLEEFTTEAPAAQPSPKKEPPKSDVPIKKTNDNEQKMEIQTAPPPEDTKFERKCPMCGGRFNLLELEKKWQCYTCAYEESNEEPKDTSVEKGAQMSAPESPPDDGPSDRKKTCPVCRKTMFWFPGDKAWRCPSCHYERRI